MKRRDFLVQIAGGWSVSALARGNQRPRSRAQGRTSRSRSNNKLDRIAVSSWSFRDYFAKTRRKELPGPLLALLDFPEMVSDRYHVHHLEFVAPHFASTQPTYLQELKVRLRRSHSYLTNIPVDITELQKDGGLSSPDAKVRERAINAAKPWVDIAHTLGARSVRCDPGPMNPDDLAPTIESYKKLTAYARSRGLQVIIENHGGVGSEHPEQLVSLFKGVKGEFIGALPDFGNFPDEETREKGLAMLFHYAKTVCHAKGLEFDDSGNETKFDFRRCVEISKQANYKGVYSIEYEGPGEAYEGVQKVIDELLRFL